MVEHDIGVECAILETKELVCGLLAVFISNRRRSPDIKYGCVSMVVPEFLRTLVFARPRGDDQFADCTFSPSLDMSR